jgi:NADH-quinone oxidoreductase subunit L
MMYYAIVFLPLLGSILTGFFGRFLGARGSEAIATIFLCISAALSIIAFVDVAVVGHAQRVPLFTFIASGELDVQWALRIDTLTAVMLVVVTGVSALVHIYSIGYMHDDPHRPRFFSFLSFFTFAMLALVTSDNFAQLFFGWEGVGLASYLLIGFWYDKPSANAAAIKAFVVNRVGDFGFMLGIAGIFALFGTLDYDQVFSAVAVNDVIKGAPIRDLMVTWFGFKLHALDAVCFLLFMGAMGKSAQFLLHTWLPDAMEGPTPVSALIHAATMVTAGVFLVCRCSYLFEYAPDARAFVTIIGAVTAFFAATIGIAQNDIKRVIAYSTCSQLGYMFFAAGLSAYGAAMFHLFTHAFFKALLFLASGSVIHALHGEQDMRKMGGLFPYAPHTAALMLVGTIALTGLGLPGVFGFAGFYSKDAILETAAAAGTNLGSLAFYLGLFAAFLTSAYSWRLIFMTFFGKHRAPQAVLDKAHESPAVMLIPLYVLAAGAVVAGLAFQYWFVGASSGVFWGNSLYVLDAHDALSRRHEVGELIKWAPTLVSLIGLGVASYFYLVRPDLPAKIAAARGPIYLLLKNKWYFDEIYDFLFVGPYRWLARLLWKGGDGRLIDGLGPDGVSARVMQGARAFVRLQTGYVYHYAFLMLIGIAAAVTFYLWRMGAP